MYRKTALLGALAVSLSGYAIAQTASDEESKLDPVIIEGSRISQATTEVGSSVSVITAEDIDRLGFEFAIDAIASAPGVTVNSNGAFGGTGSVRIRGAATGQTLVLIDGVQVNDTGSPGGGFDFARLDTENIQQIEILKGPQSTLWGTDAIGGVVFITTKRPEGGFGGSAFAEYGSFNTFRGGASLENGNETGDFRLALSGISSDGISKADENNGNGEEDAYEALTFSATGGLKLGNAARLSADLLWTDAENEYDSFAFGAEGSVGDGDELGETEELSANVSLFAPLLEGRLENLFVIGYSDITRDNFTNGAFSFGAEGDRTIFRYQGTLNIDDANTLAFGVEREETSSTDGESSIDGLFALYEFKPVETLTLTGGLRVDDHEQFGSETTGRVGVAFNPNKNITLRGSWGQGFKAPSLFQTTFFCCGATAPNSDLTAETSEAFDIGIDWRSKDGRVEAGITFFDQETDDQINFSFALGGYENIDVVESQGVEVFAEYQLTEWVSAFVDYSYIDSVDGNGNQLARVPEHSGDAALSIDPDGPFSGSVLLRYNGEEQDSFGAAVDSWTRVDLAGSYDINQRVEVFGRIENLFDEEYQQVLGYGTPDLSAYFGVRLRY